MTATQILRIVWARKWLVLAVLVIVSAIGILVTLTRPKLYTADTTMVVEMRIDPVLGALAPSLAAPGYMATQIEIMRSERVASRVVQMLGIERSAKAVQQWQEATSGKVPIERFFALLTERALRRGVFRSVAELEKAITAYIEATNNDPKPFRWIKTADDILASIQRFCLRTLGQTA